MKRVVNSSTTSILGTYLIGTALNVTVSVIKAQFNAGDNLMVFPLEGGVHGVVAALATSVILATA